LARPEDATEKIRKAQAAVARLRDMLLPHENESEEQRKSEERRQKTYGAQMAHEAFRMRLAELNQELFAVISPAEPQDRGFRLERLVKGLFELFDLDPKASFKVVREQIDGAFTFDNTDYLLEAKWQQALAGTADLDSFGGKISRKLENALGLFLAINGFTANAVQVHSTARPSMILVDGSDLMCPVSELRRHMAQTGEIYLTNRQIIG